MQHGDIWRGIDLLARTHGLSTSGLARLAGLDATAFNKSKRLPKDGRPRWPSTESISRALEAVGADFGEFADLVTGQCGTSVPLFRYTDADLSGAFDASGMPARDGSERVRIPSDEDGKAWFIIEIGAVELDRTYRSGDRLIVSRLAPLRPKDRVLIKPVSGDLITGLLVRNSDTHIELTAPADRASNRTLAWTGCDWIARILWVSQ